MPKIPSKRRSVAANSTPYAHHVSASAAKPTRTSNNIFKMNTNIGQHVLKNPGVAQAIVDKADLKQSDVNPPRLDYQLQVNLNHWTGLIFQVFFR